MSARGQIRGGVWKGRGDRRAAGRGVERQAHDSWWEWVSVMREDRQPAETVG